jgi:hypothetical protein
MLSVWGHCTGHTLSVCVGLKGRPQRPTNYHHHHEVPDPGRVLHFCCLGIHGFGELGGPNGQWTPGMLDTSAPFPQAVPISMHHGFITAVQQEMHHSIRVVPLGPLHPVVSLKGTELYKQLVVWNLHESAFQKRKFTRIYCCRVLLGAYLTYT